MKKFISIILAVAMIALSSVTAFAFEPSKVTTKDGLMIKAQDFYEYYYLYMKELPVTVPLYSDESEKRVLEIYNEIKNNIDSYTNDECQIMSDKIDEVESKMTIHKDELKWLLDYVQRDLNSENYYDDETMELLQETYNESMEVYENGNEEEIHCAYIDMRNVFTKLCASNQVAGDVNKDGHLSVNDISYMQMYGAKLQDFNSSQFFISQMNSHHDSDITIVSLWQERLANLEANFDLQSEIKCLKVNEPIQHSNRDAFFISRISNSNYLITREHYRCGSNE